MEFGEQDLQDEEPTVAIEVTLKEEEIGDDDDEGDLESSADDNGDLTFEPVEVLGEENGSGTSSEEEISGNTGDKPYSPNQKVPLKKRGRPRKEIFDKEDYEEDSESDNKPSKRKRGRPKEEKRPKRVEVCTICGKFIKNLPEHMRIHNNEKR